MHLFVPNLLLALRLMHRARLSVVVVALAVTLVLVAWLAGQFSPRQPATVALDVGISFIRLALPVLVLLQIQDLVAREVERRLILTSLSSPSTRADFLLGRYVAVLCVAFVILVLLSALLALVVAWTGKAYPQSTAVGLGWPYLVNNFLIWMDVAVVGAFGLVLAAVATTPNFVLLGGLGFMVISRSASTIVHLLTLERDLVRGAELYQQGLQWVQWLIPDLAALDVRPIVLYDKMELLTASPIALLAMPLGYVVALLILACARFAKRQFA
jgi:ABC-type transport system involved in multi-copper enzyme maturation permease subunit